MSDLLLLSQEEWDSKRLSTTATALILLCTTATALILLCSEPDNDSGVACCSQCCILQSVLHVAVGVACCRRCGMLQAVACCML